MSADRFVRVFAERVGPTPKRYFRVQRFPRAVRSRERGDRHVGLAHLALSRGYHDQAWRETFDLATFQRG